EGVRDRLRLPEHEGALAEVVEQQGWQRDPEPREADRSPAEVTQVGVEGLGAGDGQHHAAQDEDYRAAVSPEEPNGMPRIELSEDFGLARDLGGPEHTDADEPDQHDRSKDAG